MNLFELVAKLTIDSKEYINGLKISESETQEAANKVKKSFAVMAAAGVAAFGMIAKNAIGAYGDFEQLVGGAQLMYGDAYDFVAEKAKNAYKTVQMSQNDYLRQVNGFATGLKTALGGNAKAAAELADRIVTAEADVIAATGNTQEAVQNAFNGIMRSNYTMLDNLQLGITPTKEGFQEVIDKVNEWNAANGRATNYVIDNLADAQSALVDYIEMQGLAGYAQAEAADTLQGSLAALKGAWENQLNLIGEKLVPAIKTLVQVATNLIENFDTVGPIVAGLAVTFGVFAVAINIGTIIQKTAYAIQALNIVLAANPIGIVIALIAGLVVALVGLWNSNENFRKKIMGAWEAIKNFATSVKDHIIAAWNSVISKWESVKSSARDLKNSVVEKFDEIKGKIKEIVDEAIAWGRDLIQNFIDGISEKFQALKDKVAEVAQTVRDFIGFSEPKEGPLSNFHTYAPDMMKLFAQGVRDNEGLVAEQISRSLAFSIPQANGGGRLATPDNAVSGARTVEPAITIPVTLEIDGEVLARKMFRHNRDESSRRGGSLIIESI